MHVAVDKAKIQKDRVYENGYSGGYAMFANHLADVQQAREKLGVLAEGLNTMGSKMLTERFRITGLIDGLEQAIEDYEKIRGAMLKNYRNVDKGILDLWNEDMGNMPRDSTDLLTCVKKLALKAKISAVEEIVQMHDLPLQRQERPT